MKSQTEMVTFVLLFLIGVVLFISAVAWSSGIFNENADITRVTSAEAFMKGLDNKIQDVIKFSGQDSIPFNLDGTIEIANSNTLEIKMPVKTTVIPDYWITIQNDSSQIREMLDGDLFRIQLAYPEKDYSVELFTQGARLSTPRKVVIEKNSTYIFNGKTVIRIEVDFQ